MTNPRYAFRVDASNQIGYGHFMRCLTIANALKKQSIRSCFICRKETSHLQSKVIEMGHEVFNLPTKVDQNFDWKKDATFTNSIIDTLNVSWLIIDHYSIDIKWETELRKNCKNIMVIDDLANRQHDCDIILDHNPGRTDESYIDLVPKSSTILTGLKYALIRDEFVDLRNESLKLREDYVLKKILISMGGSDPKNFSTKVLKQLSKYDFLSNTKISVILGASSNFLPEVKDELRRMQHESELYVDVDNMAKILADQDLVIGAVGISAWERCCLGIPSISMVIADNQISGAKAFHLSGASIVIDEAFSNDYCLESALKFFSNVNGLRNASKIALNLVDGAGTKRVLKKLL